MKDGSSQSQDCISAILAITTENDSSEISSLAAREESSIDNEGVGDTAVENTAASSASTTESSTNPKPVGISKTESISTGPEFAIVKGGGVTTDRSGSGE